MHTRGQRDAVAGVSAYLSELERGTLCTAETEWVGVAGNAQALCSYSSRGRLALARALEPEPPPSILFY